MIKALIISMRPRQWTKNLLLFAGIIFSENLRNAEMMRNAFLGFASFCFLAGAIYIFNDLHDIQEDLQHPRKRLRPIASGAVRPSIALVWGIVAAIAGLLLAFTITRTFAIAALIYFVLLGLYSFALKHVVIVDIMVIALGFVIRAIAGVEAIRLPNVEVPLTPWFIACALFLALFLAISKRRHELVLLNERASNHRAVLEEYSPAFLDQMVAIATSATVISYALWTTAGFHKHNMVYTLPFVLYGVFRYLYIVYQKQEGGSPESELLRDVPLLVNIALWLVTVLVVLYR
jgi:4-hydroxybenzoate polyprenyltransferase